MSDNDLIYKATVQDQTGAFFDKFDARVSDLATKTESGFAKVERSISLAGVAAGAIGGAVSAVSSVVVSKVLEMTGAVKQFIDGAGQARARADTLGVTLDVVGKNAGYNKEQLGGFEEGLRKTGISLIATRESLVKMMQSELDLAKSSELARAAQDAAVIAGTNSSDAFQRILHGITTLQPEMLRTLGITVNLDQEYQKWAQTNNRTANSITYAEKKQIALNAVLKASQNIAGSYEAAMGTVGKKLGSLARYQEDLQVALGGAFQDSMGAQVDWLTEKLKLLRDWFEENQDEVQKWGERAGIVVKTFYDGVDAILGLLAKTPAAVEELGIGIAKIIGYLADISPEEIEARRSQLATYGAQAATLIIATVSAGLKTIIELGSQIVSLFTDVVWPVLTRDITASEARDRMDELNARFQNLGTFASKAFNDAAVAAGEFTGALEKAEEPAKQVEESTVKIDKAAQEAKDKLDQLSRSLDQLYRKMQEDVEARALKETRQAIEDALKEAWLQEDLARTHAERVAAITKGANDAEAQAARQYAQTKLDIERDYRRQLRDIQANFEFDASELARSRDAVGLLRLQRQTKFELQQAKVAHNDKLADAKTNYERQRQDQQRQYAEQLQALEEQEAKEAESRQRALERQRQIEELHRQWEEQDRKTAYAKQIAELLKQMGDLGKTNKDGLDALLAQWSTYFGDLLTLAQDYQAKVNSVVTPATQLNQPASAPGSSTPSPTANPSQPWGSIYSPPVPATSTTNTNSPGPRNGKIGQAGQVSSLLANPIGLLDPTGGISVPPVPTVQSGQRISGDRTITVDIRGANGLDPHVQRVLVAGLLEIERNRG